VGSFCFSFQIFFEKCPRLSFKISTHPTSCSMSTRPAALQNVRSFCLVRKLRNRVLR
jgi:hypothetical protein